MIRLWLRLVTNVSDLLGFVILTIGFIYFIGHQRWMETLMCAAVLELTCIRIRLTPGEGTAR